MAWYFITANRPHDIRPLDAATRAIQMPCNDTIRVRVPEHLAGAVKSAAAAKYLSASAYIRQAVADRLKRDGFAVAFGSLPGQGAGRSEARRRGSQ